VWNGGVVSGTYEFSCIPRHAALLSLAQYDTNLQQLSIPEEDVEHGRFMQAATHSASDEVVRTSTWLVKSVLSHMPSPMDTLGAYPDSHAGAQEAPGDNADGQFPGTIWKSGSKT